MQRQTGKLGGATSSSISDIFKDGQDFIQQGESNSEIDEKQLKQTSDFMYNMFLGVGIGLATIVGIIIGIKYVTGSVDEKADLKQALIGYVAGCVVIFGAFGIWKIVVTAIQNISK